MRIAIKHHNSERNADIVNSIINAALDAVDPYQCTRKILEKKDSQISIKDIQIDLNNYEHVYLVGTGKAVLPMAEAVQDELGEVIKGGLLIAKHESPQIQKDLSGSIVVRLGSHPIPSSQSVESTRELVKFVNSLNEKDLVICLISGGGSALMTLPDTNITIDDMQEVTRQLLFSGAAIDEVNTIRKHLDQVKGGGLARKIWPAALVTLVLSDVIGDPLEAIASGPTVSDSTTFADAEKIIEKYHLAEQIPASVCQYIKDGVGGKIQETVKAGDECITHAHTFVIGSLAIAAQAAKEKAISSGFNTEVLTTKLKGEAREVGDKLAGELINMVEGNHHLTKPACLIAGGETTVTVRGKGKGGRNQETALSAAKTLQGISNCLFISLATDGEDGPTDAAGGVVDGKTIETGNKLGLDADDHLNRNDAYTYLEKTGSLIKIGPTGTNVNDLVFLFAF